MYPEITLDFQDTNYTNNLLIQTGSGQICHLRTAIPFRNWPDLSPYSILLMGATFCPASHPWR